MSQNEGQIIVEILKKINMLKGINERIDLKEAAAQIDNIEWHSAVLLPDLEERKKMNNEIIDSIKSDIENLQGILSNFIDKVVKPILRDLVARGERAKGKIKGKLTTGDDYLALQEDIRIGEDAMLVLESGMDALGSKKSKKTKRSKKSKKTKRSKKSRKTKKSKRSKKYKSKN